jgi:NitT/TauT family transport system permease protein
VIPNALPIIVTGLELGLVYSFQGAVAGEFLGGLKGLGIMLSLAGNTFETADFFAELVILVVVSTLIIQIIRFIANRLLRWNVIEMHGTR